jgi:hypothetical protein
MNAVDEVFNNRDEINNKIKDLKIESAEDKIVAILRAAIN